MSERPRLNIRTSDEIIARIEALSHLSGESKNSVANVLLAIQLGGTTCGTTSRNEDMGSNPTEGQDASVVESEKPKKPRRKSGTTKNKGVSPPTPPSSPKEKDIPKGISKKKKVSLNPPSLDEVVEYFRKRRIPEPVLPKAETFHDFYEANGWVQGKNKPLYSWHAALTTWLVRDGCPTDWKPTEKPSEGGTTLEAVLEWMQKERPEYYEKFKQVKKINDIDGFYIDEFRGA